jgi:hypothetical protein
MLAMFLIVSRQLIIKVHRMKMTDYLLPLGSLTVRMNCRRYVFRQSDRDVSGICSHMFLRSSQCPTNSVKFMKHQHDS